jgi:hypothetical protein
MAQKLNHNSKINSTAPGGSQKNDGIKKYRQEKGIHLWISEYNQTAKFRSHS